MSDRDWGAKTGGGGVASDDHANLARRERYERNKTMLLTFYQEKMQFSGNFLTLAANIELPFCFPTF